MVMLILGCKPCCPTCGCNAQPQQQQTLIVVPPKEEHPALILTIVGWDKFPGQVQDCPTGNPVDVYGANQNLLGKYPTDKTSLLKILQGWIYFDIVNLQPLPAPTVQASPDVAMVDWQGKIVGSVTNVEEYHIVEVGGQKKKSDTLDMVPLGTHVHFNLTLNERIEYLYVRSGDSVSVRLREFLSADKISALYKKVQEQ